MKILLVDDEKPLRDMVGTFLKKQGHEIESAASVTEGLEKVVSARPDMVLLDLNLPDGTGLDFLKDVGALAPDLTVVLVTAHVDVKTAVEAIKRGTLTIWNSRSSG
jgi:DNA-binding NtrC family response regulator